MREYLLVLFLDLLLTLIILVGVLSVVWRLAISSKFFVFLSRFCNLTRETAKPKGVFQTNQPSS